jgi:hypothetical protein
VYSANVVQHIHYAGTLVQLLEYGAQRVQHERLAGAILLAAVRFHCQDDGIVEARNG